MEDYYVELFFLLFFKSEMWRVQFTKLREYLYLNVVVNDYNAFLTNPH